MIVDRGPEERTLGAMLFLWDAENAVGAADAALIAAVADQCALALERTRLYDAERAARAAAEAAETRLRDVFEQAPMAVAVLSGPEHVYTVVSPRYFEFGGGRQMIGLPFRAAFPEATGLAELMDHVYQTGQPFYASERVVPVDRDRDGVPEEYRFNIGYQPLRDAGGRVYAIASTAVEVTEQVRARAEVERARDEALHARAAAEAARVDAEDANQAKAQFLTTMSHELRTPLNAIGGYAQLVEMGLHGPVTPAQVEALVRIRRSQQHLLGLINSVLNYAKLEAGQVHYDVADVPVLDVVRTVEALVAPQAQAQALRLTIEPCAGDLTVRADAEKLRQVLLNLLSNAVKFTGAGGTVQVECAGGDAEMVALRVRDTGRGIPPEQIARVFEPFVQVGRRLASSDEGTGLGLAISRDLARGMGGDLTAESEVGVGSTFTLTLPRAQAGTDTDTRH
jgi:signal transduction histidine kinase